MIKVIGLALSIFVLLLYIFAWGVTVGITWRMESSLLEAIGLLFYNRLTPLIVFLPIIVLVAILFIEEAAEPLMKPTAKSS